MGNVETNTVLDTLGTLFISLAGFCIAQLTSAHCDTMCISTCALSLAVGVFLIYCKYKLR